MKTNVDFLIINNSPSFYKINLYNELSKLCKIHVVFVGITKQVVVAESFRDKIEFSYELLFSDIAFEKRNKYLSFIKICFVVNEIKYKKIIFGGYSDLEFLLLSFLLKKKHNCLQLESSILESKTDGINYLIKKIIFSRYGVVFSSGSLQTKILRKLNFKSLIIETKGVGIFNKSTTGKKIKISNVNKDFRYLFVGRLIEVKNVEYLIQTFNKLDKKLTIVGTGALESKLNKIANDNIEFRGFVDNVNINSVYVEHDIFILPSLSEAWGLVVEEAIYFGLPVLVSSNVGCYEEMVEKCNTGIVFNLQELDSLKNSINLIENNYEYYHLNCLNYDFNKRDKLQVESYLKGLPL